jgi:hypothetical protein
MTNDLITSTLSIEDLDKIDILTFDWETFVSMGMVAREWKDASQWVLGKLALGVEKIYGLDAIGKYANEIGINKKTLQRYRWVVKHFPKVKAGTQKQLPFYAYEAVANTDDPSKWIDRAIDKDWTPGRLLREVQSYKTGVPMDKLNLVICPKCHFKFNPSLTKKNNKV